METNEPRPGARGAAPDDDHGGGNVGVSLAAGPVDERWLRAAGRQLAADERLRTMRIARIRLDRLLREPAGEHEHICPGQFGADGTWRPHCRPGAA